MKRGPGRGLEPHENKFFEKRRLRIKGPRYPSLRVGAGALGPRFGDWTRAWTETRNSRVGNLAAPRVSAVSSLEPSFSSFSSLTCSGGGSGSGFQFVLTIHMANKTIPN